MEQPRTRRSAGTERPTMTLRRHPNEITRTRCSWTSSGFTLVELMAVMVVVAILAATAAPAIHSVSQTRQLAAGKQLLRDVSFTKQHAHATGTRAWIVFDLDAQSWSVLSEDPENRGRANAVAIIDPGTGREMTRLLGSGTLASVGLISVGFDGGSELGFDWLGRPLNANEELLANAGTVTISGGQTLIVEVGTGHARLE